MLFHRRIPPFGGIAESQNDIKEGDVTGTLKLRLPATLRSAKRLASSKPLSGYAQLLPARLSGLTP